MKEENQQEIVSSEKSITWEKLKSIFSSRKKREREVHPDHEEEKQVKWVQIRLIPIWLRIILVLLLLVSVSVLGLYIGYSVIGDGAPSDIFKKGTWTHMIDIIKGIE